jgi:hypothetical protein
LWKLGNIIAFFKKGDKSDPGNYWPVNLTSIVGKLMEKIVRKVIVIWFKTSYSVTSNLGLYQGDPLLYSY